MEFVKMIEVIKCLKEAGSVIIFVDFFMSLDHEFLMIWLIKGCEILSS